MAKGAHIYLARVVIERLLGLLLFLIGSSWTIGAAGIMWFIFYFAAAGVVLALYRVNPESMDQRTNIVATKDSTPLWDKKLLTAFWLLGYFVIYFVAGLFFGDHAAAPTKLAFGLILYALSTGLTYWALRENKFAESTARLQPERNQTVCTSGPYALVRHPMYTAILMWCICIVMVFPCLPVLAVSALTAAIIVKRTKLEDAMLAEGLPGYQEYQQRTKHMLIPFVF